MMGSCTCDGGYKVVMGEPIIYGDLDAYDDDFARGPFWPKINILGLPHQYDDSTRVVLSLRTK